MKRKVQVFCLLFVVGAVAQNAFAMPVLLLPESNYYQGHTYYEEDSGGGIVLSGRIDFAVYDTEADDYVEPFTPPGEGRYIYAYQIFNDSGFDNEDVENFAVLFSNASLDGIDFERADDEDAIEPADAYFDPEENPTKAVYSFAGGFIAQNEHSCFLIFTSDDDWTPGEYEITGTGGELSAPVPEPATIMLLGLGAAVTFRPRRRKKV